MKDFTGKTAVITGGASGIGLGIGRSLAKRGVNIAILDIEGPPLDGAAEELSSLGVRVTPMVVDVTNRQAMYDAAERIIAEFGRLDIAINNAGIAYNATPLHEAPDEMIDWSVNVNLFGVLNAVKAFVPRILAAGNGGHVVNTSSIGGFQIRKSPILFQTLYAATKYAVTAISEGMRADLADQGVGVSVLAPSAVATAIGSSDRNRQDIFGGPTTGAQNDAVGKLLGEQGMAAHTVGERVIRGIIDNEAYIFTHLEGLPILEERHRRIEAGFEATRSFMEEISN